MARRRLFTPKQANLTLPLVRRIVADILGKGRELRSYSGRRLRDEDAARADVLRSEIHDLIQELEQIGCSFKDWNFQVGLVDFPSKIGGEIVLLCWRSDEPTVSWYHRPEAGFAGRTPIPIDLLEEPEPDENEASQTGASGR